MGELIRTFTYPRNAFAATVEKSAVKALSVIDRVERGELNQAPDGRYKDEAFNDSRLFLAIVGGPLDQPHVTSVGHRFMQLSRQSETAAWRWLVTRSMWLYSVPNGSNAVCNQAANNLGIEFNFFDMVTRLAVHFSALPEPENILYFDELLSVLDVDSNWTLSGQELFGLVLDSRQHMALEEPHHHADLLGTLEPQYETGRDYLNTVFRKALGQSGLFQIISVGSAPLGIRLDPASYENPVLAERLRFVLDNPRRYRPDG